MFFLFIRIFFCLFWPNALCTKEAFYSFGTWIWYTEKKRHFEVFKVVNNWLLTNFLTFFLIMNVLISLLSHALPCLSLTYSIRTWCIWACAASSEIFNRSDIAGKRVFRIVFLTTLVAPAFTGGQKVCSEGVSARRNIWSESKEHVQVCRITLTGLI